MIKKTVTYEDFDGKKVTEDLYFHLSAMEAVELDQSTDGGITQVIQDLLKSGNGSEILLQFKKLIQLAYGVRSEGGRFIKNKADADAFIYSPAFDALLADLLSKPEQAGTFIEGMVSKSLLGQINAGQDATTGAVNTVQLPAGEDEPEWLKLGRTPTNQELMKATPAQIQKAFVQRQAANSPTE